MFCVCPKSGSPINGAHVTPSSYVPRGLSLRCVTAHFNWSFQLKCHKYWPDQSEEYGDITVTLMKSEQYADYVIRTFNVKRVNILFVRRIYARVFYS